MNRAFNNKQIAVFGSRTLTTMSDCKDTQLCDMMIWWTTLSLSLSVQNSKQTNRQTNNNSNISSHRLLSSISVHFELHQTAPVAAAAAALLPNNTQLSCGFNCIRPIESDPGTAAVLSRRVVQSSAVLHYWLPLARPIVKTVCSDDDQPLHTQWNRTQSNRTHRHPRGQTWLG